MLLQIHIVPSQVQSPWEGTFMELHEISDKSKANSGDVTLSNNYGLKIVTLHCINRWTDFTWVCTIFYMSQDFISVTCSLMRLWTLTINILDFNSYRLGFIVSTGNSCECKTWADFYLKWVIWSRCWIWLKRGSFQYKGRIIIGLSTSTTNVYSGKRVCMRERERERERGGGGGGKGAGVVRTNCRQGREYVRNAVHWLVCDDSWINSCSFAGSNCKLLKLLIVTFCMAGHSTFLYYKIGYVYATYT